MSKKKSAEKQPAGGWENRRRRYDSNKQQERLSEAQATLCFIDWPVDRIQTDLGEDLLVRIYDDGRSTGLSFFVQMKSVESLDESRHKLKKSPTVSYPIDVEHLLHWEDQNPPVFLLVWDVTNRKGAWTDLPTALRDLDKRQKHWRSRSPDDEVSVHIPLSNTTDEEGRQGLRLRLAHLTLPVLGKGKTLEITPTFTFPNTPDGKKYRKAFHRLINRGDAVTIPSTYITGFKASDWWERAMGQRIPYALTFSSSESELVIQVELVATGERETATLPLFLRKVKAGRKEITLSNKHDKRTPVPMTMRVDDHTIRAKFRMLFPAFTIPSTLAVLRFWKLLHETKTATMLHHDGASLGDFGPSDIAGLMPLEEVVAWESVIQKLSYVQKDLRRFGSFDLTHAPTEDDVREIDRLYGICQTGTWTGRGSCSLHLDRPPDLSEIPEPPDGMPSFRMAWRPFDTIQLLGVTIPLGDVEAEFLNAAEVIEACRQAGVKGLKTVRMKNAVIKFHLQSWGPVPTTSKRKRQNKRRK